MVNTCRYIPSPKSPKKIALQNQSKQNRMRCFQTQFSMLQCFLHRLNILGHHMSCMSFSSCKKHAEYSVFNIPMVFEKTSQFRLKSGFIIFSLSIFRISVRPSPAFRLPLSSLQSWFRSRSPLKREGTVSETLGQRRCLIVFD